MNFLTVLLSGLAAAAPQFISALPHQWATVATAAMATGGALYHLFQPAPPTN